MDFDIQDSDDVRGESRSFPLAITNERLANLVHSEPVSSVSPHHFLTEGVWLSTEADKGAELSVVPSETGFALRLSTAGRSGWVTLSFTLPLEALRSGRYLCFLVRVASRGFLSYRPSLRYLHVGGGFSDSFTRDYMVSSGGQEEEQLCHILINPDELARSEGADALFFFQGSSFWADFRSIEVVLIA